jgi:hypothetical protein
VQILEHPNEATKKAEGSVSAFIFHCIIGRIIGCCYIDRRPASIFTAI